MESVYEEEKSAVISKQLVQMCHDEQQEQDLNKVEEAVLMSPQKLIKLEQKISEAVECIDETIVKFTTSAEKDIVNIKKAA